MVSGAIHLFISNHCPYIAVFLKGNKAIQPIINNKNSAEVKRD